MEPDAVTVVVEIPKGSRNKYEMDPASGVIVLDRMLFSSMQYPAEKILCVPLKDPMWSHVQDLQDMNPNLLNEIEHFFAVYKTLEHKEVGTEGFGERTEALGVIAAARAAAANP